MVPLLNEDPAEHAALEVADRLALRIDDDRAAGDGSTAELRREGPAEETAESNEDRRQPGDDEAPDGRMRVVLRKVRLWHCRGETSRRGHRQAAFRAFSLHGRLQVEANRQDLFLVHDAVPSRLVSPGIMVATTSVRGPNWLMRPPSSTSSLSATCMMAGRWAIRMTMAPSLRASSIARMRARSPRASRLALGSSRTSRRGRP